MSDMQMPDDVSERGFARWGQEPCQPYDAPRDPVPTVYSCSNLIEVDELCLDLAAAEALVARLQAAIAYERAKAGGAK